MITREAPHPHVHALATKLVADIRRRGLATGDRYLTTASASRMLRVPKAVASKAMRHLAQQQVLIARPGAGTFIGPGLEKENRSTVQTVYVLLTAGNPSATHWAYHPFITGIRRAVPGANVQFTFIPDGNPLPYVEELITKQRASGQLLGIVAVSCPSEVYRYLGELDVPAVVSGSLHCSTLQLASVDLDNHRSGELLTQYLIGRGHRHMALLTAGAGRPGENDFIDGIVDALTAAGLAPNTLVQRLVRNDTEALLAIAEELLEKPNRPTAIVTRGSVLVDALASVAAKLGLAVPDDVEIVFDHMDQTAPHIDTTSYPRVEAKLPFVEYAAIIGRILKEVSEGSRSHTGRVVIPVEFCKPRGTLTQADSG